VLGRFEDDSAEACTARPPRLFLRKRKTLERRPMRQLRLWKREGRGWRLVKQSILWLGNGVQQGAVGR